MAERYDVVILGGGPGGEAVVRRLEGAGLRVALVERELVGGECAHWGCAPSKTLLRAPELRAAAGRTPGLSVPALSWPETARYRDEMISHLDDHAKAAKMEAAGATVIRGEGRIAAPGTVAVGDRTLEARRIVIATGTDSAVPPIDGLETLPYWTNRELTTMQAVPRDAIVLGGGPVGLESAQLLRRLGAGVTIVEASPRLLDREDPGVSEHIARRFAEEGIAVRCGAEAASAREVDGRAVLAFDDHSELDAERIVVATGREPRVEGIGLDAVGIEPGATGGIDVDEQCRAGEGVWAVGDVTMVAPFTHVAHYQGEIVADTILGRQRRADYRAIPRVVFTDPEIAAVGSTRAQAEEDHITLSVGTVDLDALARTELYGTGYRGELQVLADRDEGVLIGAWAVAPLASEWIGAAVLAIKARVPIATLRDTPMQFPTFGEALSYAVDDL